MQITPQAMASFQALLVGFAFAGLVASAFELVTSRRAGFNLLQGGGLRAVASVPVVVFSAPFLILRNTLRGRRLEQRPILFVMIATVIAGLWSLACGQVLIGMLGRALLP